MTQTNTGSKYKSLRLTIPSSTTDYNVAKENSSEFPDWSADRQDRDWFNVLVIKRMEPTDGSIDIKFHDLAQNSITIDYCDTPAIIDDFIFRDVFITNGGADDVTFDIIFFSPLVIKGTPRRPTGLKIFADTNVTITFKDNNVDEEHYIVERSEVGPDTGFATIGQAKFSNFNQIMGKNREFIDKTVSSGTTYWYRMYAVKDGLNSSFSEVVSIAVP